MDGSVRFKHNLILEYVMQDLFGRKHYGGMAGAFADPAYCKECMQRAVKRIRKRLDEILTMDERLRQITGIILGRLENHAKEISKEVNNDWDIIAHLLDLIAHLLGYDWLDGRVHRHVLFYQDKTQEQVDWKMRKGTREYYDLLRLEEKRRYMLVNFLKKNKIPKYQIAKLLGITVRRVNRILHEIEGYKKETGKSLTKFEKELD